MRFSVFRFLPFFLRQLRFFGFVVRCGFRVFRFLASGFRFFGKTLDEAVVGFWWPMFFFGFSNLEVSQRQTCTGSQFIFCGCAALSTEFPQGIFLLLQACLLEIYLFCGI